MSLAKLIILTGPTAAGKTALSLKLAKKFRGEIISADSRQIYRGMDIGTAKVTKKEQRIIPHHLIDIRNPNQLYSLAEFKRDAIKSANDIIRRGRVPFLVGGTALYIWAITDNPEIPEVKPNAKLRKQLESRLKLRGVDYLYAKLIKQDSGAAGIIDSKNPRRIIRALEIIQATRKPFSATRKKGPKLFDILLLGVQQPPKKLKQNINKRAKQQIKQGLVKEVKRFSNHYDRSDLKIDAIGYGEITKYLNGEVSLPQAIEEIKKNTWQFAKRQETWFKKMPIHWIGTQKQAETKIKKFLA